VKQRRQKGVDQAIPRSGGDIRHPGPVANQPTEVVPRELLGPKRLLPELADQRPAGGKIQVGQVERRHAGTPGGGDVRGEQR
jgi:hypothetical protein